MLYRSALGMLETNKYCFKNKIDSSGRCFGAENGVAKFVKGCQDDCCAQGMTAYNKIIGLKRWRVASKILLLL